jgi:hypothetical protein
MPPRLLRHTIRTARLVTNDAGLVNASGKDLADGDPARRRFFW